MKIDNANKIALPLVQFGYNYRFNECNLVQPCTKKVQIWETMGISRRTYYYRKNKGVI